MLPSGVLHHTCYAHAVHLVVSDVLYKNQGDSEVSETESEDQDTVDEGDVSDDDFADDMNMTCTWEESALEARLTATIRPAIDKVRKIARFFRKSPVKNDHLQKIIKEEKGREMALIVDVRIRWNSMLKMLSRFLEIKSSVAKALLDNGRLDLFPSQDEIDSLCDVNEALEFVEIASLVLGKRDSNLVKSEKIFEFLLKNLGELDGKFAHSLLKAMENRISKRRPMKLATLLLYLEDPNSIDDTSVLPRKNRNEIAKTSKMLFFRLFKEQSVVASVDDNDDVTEPPAKLSKASQLEMLISNDKGAMKRRRSRTTPDLLKELKLEMAVFESTGKRPNSLEALYQALITVPPTSVEAERCFSAAGLFVTKLRTSLNDETIDKLCFLRSFFRPRKI